MAFHGMKKRDRDAHLKLLESNWNFWQMMNTEQLQELAVQQKQGINPNLPREKIEKRLNGKDKDGLIRELVITHVKQMA